MQNLPNFVMVFEDTLVKIPDRPCYSLLFKAFLRSSQKVKAQGEPGPWQQRDENDVSNNFETSRSIAPCFVHHTLN